MSDYVNNNLLDASPIRKQKEESAKLVAKWDKSGLLEGMDNEWQKSGMATLLENQARQLISENSKTSPNTGTGVGDEEWSGVALPLVRRVFGNIVAQELVSVQPMNLPSGLVFFLDFKYGTSVGKFTSGQDLLGKQGPNSPSGSSAPFGEDTGLYGVGRYGYSISQSTATATGTDGGHASFQDIDFNSEVSASLNAADQFLKVNLPISSFTNPDLKAVRAWNYTPAGANANAKVLTQFTKVVGANVQLVVSGAAAGQTTGSYTVDFVKQTTAGDRGDFEDTVKASTSTTNNIIINISRAIIYASSTTDYLDNAEKALEFYNNKLIK